MIVLFAINIHSFSYLTTHIESSVLRIIGSQTLAYVEADYFGGQGGQLGIIWSAGRGQQQFPYGPGVINQTLRYFNVVAEAGKDEFETLELDRHRRRL